MITVRWALGAIIAATAVSASTDELQLFARLLKRQEPGSPAYNCHDNCGQAIIQGRNSADVCHDDTFLTDYKACLQCAGPDNQDIWQYYGATLTRDATPCGLSTTPLSGKQPDVGPAIPASSGSSSATQSTASATSSATEPPSSESSATATETSTAGESSSEGTSAPSSTAEVTGPSTSSETSGPVGTGSSSGHATAPATESASGTTAVSTSFTPTGTGSASGSGNGTAPTSSGVVVVNNAGKISGSSFGFYGALALGAFYAVTQ
ncbi:hypothetical protein F5Y13DRAFT_205664 [Hypoxylon sp. FL1857]|nr:hypothetical protein F5Y13DRAFT_205664 [Hypoxylon sp. FL1857]